MLSCSSAPPRSLRAIGMSWRRSERRGAAAAFASADVAQQRKTRNLILVAADGLR
jgi:hypothetical protein